MDAAVYGWKRMEFNVRPSMENRVAERLRRLRERFGQGIRDHHVDHDNLTSTRLDLVPCRTFFLGEIWWTDRFALGDHRPYREGSSHRPALVTRREPQPDEPIEMAPSAYRSPSEVDEFCFRATEPPEGLREQTWFLLHYGRPVSRRWIGAPMGQVSGREKQQLTQLLGLLQGPGKRPS